MRVPLRGGVGDQLVEHRDQHAQALDREAGLAGVGAVQEALEGRDLGQAVEQLALVDRIVRRAETLLSRRPRAASARSVGSSTWANS